MDWLKKLAGYAPDIVGAIVSGGATLPATAIRIASKELLGYETDDQNVLAKAVEAATPDEMLKLNQANNNFVIRKLELQNEEMASARKSYATNHKQADDIAKSVMRFNVIYVVLVALAQIAAITLTELPDAAVVVIGNVCGWIIKGLLDERIQVCGFYFGSSIGSKTKDK